MSLSGKYLHFFIDSIQASISILITTQRENNNNNNKKKKKKKERKQALNPIWAREGRSQTHSQFSCCIKKVSGC
jgi:hypothetical protein